MAFKSKPKGEPFEVEGFVKNTGSKDFKGTTYYNLFLEDDKELYRCGTNEPDVQKGDYVKLTGIKDDYGYQVKDLEEAEAPAKAPRKAKAPAKDSPRTETSKTEKMSKDDYWVQKAAQDAERQTVISYQTATNTSVEVVNAALAQGFLPMAGKSKEDKFEVYVGMVEKVAAHFFNKYRMAASESFLAEMNKLLEETEDTPEGEPKEDQSGTD